jgi:diguanylate cyclase
MFALFQRILLVLPLAALIAAANAQAAPGPIVLDGSQRFAAAWPAVTLLADPSGVMTRDEVRARKDEFAAPDSPWANLGVRRDPVWLKIPVSVPAGGPSRWMLSIDYPSIDRIELFVEGGAQPDRPTSMGRQLPFSLRPWPSSGHATELDLAPGKTYELLLRVQTTSTMIVPITLSTPEAFHFREVRDHLLQGLMAGAGLCLLLYSLSQWVGLRDPMFLHYALTLAGTTLFFISYFGLGAQHLWGDNGWLTEHAPPLTVLLGGLLGGFLFIDRALGVRDIQPRISLALRLGAATSAVLGLLYAADLVDYRFAQLGATALGPLPMLLTIPVAWARARGGDRIGWYMLLGWGVYGLGTLIMVGLLRGLVAADYLTLHAFQFGSIFEMLMWLGVLSLRTEALRAAAHRAQVERDALHSLAHSDPLTGLPNRRGLNDALARALPACSADRIAAVYLLDLDGFKPINDRLGHEGGDEVLVGVARRLKSSLRASDVVTRLGGDEFVVLATGLPGETEARALGQKLLNAFAKPFEAAGHQCQVGVTIGYALAPFDGHDPLDLLKRADAAMYAGKESGRNCVQRGGASVVMTTASS